MKMNKILGCSVIALSLAAGQAFAGSDPATPDVVDGHGAILTVSAANKFVDKSFDYTLSSNVGAATAQDPVSLTVQTAHLKGLYKFGGSSNGGTVHACGSTPADTGFPSGASAPTAGGDGCS